MKKYISFSFFFTLLFSFTTIAQELQWVAGYGSSGSDRLRSMKISNNGGVMSVGSFENTVDFDPSSTINTHTSNGLTDIYVNLFDTNGNLLWVNQIGGSGQEIGRSITTDLHSNVYVAGDFSNIVDFDPGASSMQRSSNGARDIFICKFDPLGNLIWVKTFGGIQNESVLDIQINDSDELLLTGHFEGTVDFDPNSGVMNRTSNGNEDIFIAKWDSSGSLLWLNTYGTSSSFFERGYRAVFDHNNDIVFVGIYSGTIDFDPGPGISNVSSVGEEDGFICKLDSGGNLVWIKSIGSVNQEILFGVDIGSQNDIYFNGYYRGTIDLDPGSGTDIKSHVSATDILIVKLDELGNYQWGKSITAPQSQTTRDITVGKDDNLYMTGYYFSSVDFDPGPGQAILNDPGNGSTYLLRLTNNGDFKWVYPISSPTINSGYDIATDKMGNIYFGGLFSGTVDFDPQMNNISVTSNGGYDAFIQKIFDCDTTHSSFFEIACKQYTSPSGKYIWTASGNYKDTIVNAAGCDSIMDISLFIINPDTSVLINDPTLTSNASNSTYQWLDCNNNYSIIQGETGASFTATSNGSYAVEVTENGCKDTSSCYQIFTIGLEKIATNPYSFSIYPNPSDGILHIQSPDNAFDEVLVNDITGKLIYQKKSIRTNNIKLKLDTKPGIYFLTLRTEGITTGVEKVIIK